MAYELTRCQRLSEQCSLLNEEQRAAVRRYLEFIAEEPEYEFYRDDIDHALEGFWANSPNIPADNVDRT